MNSVPGSELGPLQITDEDLVTSAPTVRALLVSRLEQLWSPVAQVLQDANQGLGPVDPRMLEIGLRIVKEEAFLYRLAKPLTASEQPEEEAIGAGVDRFKLVEAKLAEVESRIRSQADPGS